MSAPVFPRTLKAGVDYCLDPQGEIRSFGEKGKLTLEDVCTTAVDGECEVYKHFGLKRFVSLRYVDGSGAGGSVEVYLSQFADPGGAYGMFTKRVVADGDPADPSAPKFLDAGGARARSAAGRAYAWRADQLAEPPVHQRERVPRAAQRLERGVCSRCSGAAASARSIKAPPTEPPPAAALPSVRTSSSQNAISVPAEGRSRRRGRGRRSRSAIYKDGRSAATASVALQKSRRRSGEGRARRPSSGKPASVVVPVGARRGRLASRRAPGGAGGGEGGVAALARRGPLIAGAGDEETLAQGGGLRPSSRPRCGSRRTRRPRSWKCARRRSWRGPRASAVVRQEIAPDRPLQASVSPSKGLSTLGRGLPERGTLGDITGVVFSRSGPSQATEGRRAAKSGRWAPHPEAPRSRGRGHDRLFRPGSARRTKHSSAMRAFFRVSAVAAMKRVVTGSWYPLASGRSETLSRW